MDEEGIITAKLEAYTTAEEIEDELERLLTVSEVRGLLVEVEAVSLTELAWCSKTGLASAGPFEPQDSLGSRPLT